MTLLQKSKAEAKRKKAGLACAKNLAAASKSLSEYITACNECDDASRLRGIDDSRMILVGNINEYQRYLTSRYEG